MRPEIDPRCHTSVKLFVDPDSRCRPFREAKDVMTRRGEIQPKASDTLKEDIGRSLVQNEPGWFPDLRSWFSAALDNIPALPSGALRGLAIAKQAFTAVVSRIASTTLLFGIGVVFASGLHALLSGPQGYGYTYSLFQDNATLEWILRNKEYAYIAVGSAIAALSPVAFSWLKRLTTSWISGVVCELPFVSFLAAVIVFTPSPRPIMFRCVASLTIVALACLISYVLRSLANWLGAKRKSQAGATVQALPRQNPDLANDSDDPVASWEDDLLDRPPLIELLSIKVLKFKKPVVILDGRFGAGKSSVLNLLRLRLKGEAIIVSFSAWLPGSGSTLTDFLVSDIVTECRKRFIVPGLARSARRFVNAAAKSVPYLTGLTEFLPASTQLNAVNQLKASLQRVPMRVVVLIDEVDRMQKDEVLALLKLLRGVAGIPNLSFVCACNKEEVMRVVRPAEGKKGEESRKYFEKFFLDVIPLSEPTPETLEQVGIGRIVRALKACESFKTDEDEQTFQTALAKLWTDCFAPFCCNLRKIGIVANDLHGVATLLGRNVNYIDLALITLLRRMNPEVHALAAGQLLILTGGSRGLKQYRYLNDNERSRREKQFAEQVDKLCVSEENKKNIHTILTALFPLFPRFLGRVAHAPDLDGLEISVRISYPWMFEAYFRLEIPKDVFSAAALNQFLESIRDAKERETVSGAFSAILQTMEVGAERRQDFLWKISLSIRLLGGNVAKWLALSAMQFADKYQYDRGPSLWGESIYAFRVAREAMFGIAKGGRADFLRECISEAGDDTMAFALIAKLTDLRESKQQLEEGIRLPLRAVWNAFTTRMRTRYGPAIDAASDDAIRTSDPGAFALWGRADLQTWGITAKPSDREMRDGFWTKYIGLNKQRLARVFEGFLMPMADYTSDPSPFVEQRISLTLLSRLNMEALYAPELTKEEAGSLRRLDRLLKGDYKDGVPITEWQSQ